MWADHVFYILILSQIILVSHYLPGRLMAQVKEILRRYPQSEFPRLYPVPLETLEANIKTYSRMNCAVMLLGLVMLSHAVFTSSRELLGWDNNGVQSLYFFLQYLPLILVGRLSFRYLKLMKQQNSASTRKAWLNPRRLLDYISPFILACAMACYLIYVGIVLYFIQFPFDGFAGVINILVVTLINMLFALQIYRHIYGKRHNPLESDADRIRGTRIFVKLLVVGSIGISIYLSMSLIMAALDLRQIQDMVFSVYCQLLTVITFYSINFRSVNFDVYRADPITS